MSGCQLIGVEAVIRCMAVEISSDHDDGVVDAMVNCKSSRCDGDPDDDDGVVDAMVNCKK